jgi:hypothetical protein
VKTDNVFRFVSIRPPGNPETNGKRMEVREDTVRQDVLNQLSEQMTADRGNLDVARLTLGARLIASDDYYLRSSDWSPLVPLGPGIDPILTRALTSDLAAFRTEADSLLARGLGPGTNVDSFQESAISKRLIRSIWMSFYANILHPYVRPGDREDIRRWIYFLTLITTTKDEAAYNDLAPTLPTLRLSVPVLFYKLNLAPERPEPPLIDEPLTPTAPPKNPIDVDRLKDRIVRLERTRQFLNELFVTRLRTFRATVSTPEVTRGSDAAAAEGTRGQPPTEGVRRDAEGGQLRDAPWRLSSDLLEGHEEHVAVLRENQLSPELLNHPELVYAIEEQIARLNGAIQELATVEHVVGVGPTLARVTTLIPEAPNNETIR